VKGSWKGVSEEPVDVYGHGLEASCGIESDEDKSYPVYAYRSGRDGEGPLQTGLCASAKPLEQADEDPRVLGRPEGPIPDTGGCGASPSDDAAAVAAVSALLALVGVILR